MGRKIRTLDREFSDRLRLAGPDETVTFIGRCPIARCKNGKRLDMHGLLIISPDDKLYKYGQEPEARFEEKGYVFPEGSRWISGASYMTNFAQDDNVCPEHGWCYEFKGLQATYVSTVACSEACEEATGSKCRCSCGGANHGARA